VAATSTAAPPRANAGAAAPVTAGAAGTARESTEPAPEVGGVAEAGTGALLGGGVATPPEATLAVVEGVPAGGVGSPTVPEGGVGDGAGPGAAAAGEELESDALEVLHTPAVQTCVLTVPLLEEPAGPLVELAEPLDVAEVLVLDPPGAFMVSTGAAPGSWTSD
jgi:hypothetical protein